MGRRRLAIALALVASLDSIGAQQLQKTITVVSGTYGGDCKARPANKTAALAAACNGHLNCTFKVDYKQLGVPPSGCGNEYVAEWRCGASGTVHRYAVPREERFGGLAFLVCEEPTIIPNGHAAPGSINVVAGTYGGNCKQPRGNRTVELLAACNGKETCTYTIDYLKDLSDPAVGCVKDYAAEWRCGDASDLHRAGTSGADAGFGQSVDLSCQSAATLAAGLKTAGTVVVRGIYFDVDKASLKPDSNPVLDQVAKMLSADSSFVLEVSGHTDNTGSADHNLKLSEARAQAVVDALVKGRGVAANRLKAKGYGDTKPVAANDVEANRAKNRRVELHTL